MIFRHRSDMTVRNRFDKQKWGRRFQAFALALSAAVFAVACGGDRWLTRAEEGRVVYNLATEPETLDPAKATGLPESEVCMQVLENLVALDEHLRIVPRMAERWTLSEDRRTYTFFLRQAEWSDGKPVTAHDFVYEWRRVLAPETASEYAQLLYYIQGGYEYNTGESKVPESVGVKALDDHTLEVRLVRPTPYFLSMVSHRIFSPFRPETVAAGPREWRQRPESYLSCGPFRIAAWRSHSHIILRKNPTYYDAAVVRLNEVRMIMLEKESSALAAYESGQLDSMRRPPNSAMDRMRRAGQIQFAPHVATYFANFNCERPPFDNPLVRRAFALAIDREIITRYLSRAGEKPATAFVPYGIADAEAESDFRSVGGDLIPPTAPEEARRLLAEAGYPDGDGLPEITYIYNTKEIHAEIAAELQQRWKKNLGVEVRLANMEWKVFLRTKRDGDFQIARGAWVGDYPDPTTFLECYMSESGNNMSHWKNATYDALIEEANRMDDPVERMACFHRAEALMMEAMPLAPIYFYTEPYIQRPALHGVMRNSVGDLSFRDAWWETGSP